MKKIQDIYKNHRFFVFFILVILNLLLVSKLILTGRFYPETIWLNKNNLDFKELQTYFRDLANKKGAEYAFQVLNSTNLPPDTDVHLLAHSVGDILYKQKGVKGIQVCTDDFRNACSHSIVIGLFIERGIDAIVDIAKACREAPGGSGSYAMCFHGLGHGVLAYAEYDMMTALNLCRKVGTAEFNYVESGECVGGIVMEMVNGVHDKDAWDAQKDNYFKKDNPLYPCDQGIIPSNGRFYCFWYLTPHLWESAGGDFSNPNASDFEKAFKYCGNLTGDKEEYKEACYGGFGKEFVVFASPDGDIRKVESMTKEGFAQIYNWCALAKVKEGVEPCIAQAVNALYWGGENGSNIPTSFCNEVLDKNYKDMCFSHLIGSFKFYKNGAQMFKECSYLPADYKKICLSTK